MHGIILFELQRFLDSTVGPGTWDKALREAHLGGRVYNSLGDYPDEELYAIVGAASGIARMSNDETVEAFGTFIAPNLLHMYSMLIKPEWRTLDVIEHTEAVIHAVVRVTQQGAKPPELKCRRIGPDEIELRYDSSRRLCRLARGIVKGIAREYHEEVTVVEYECMHRGASACLMHVRYTG